MRKMFYSSAELIANDSSIDKAFGINTSERYDKKIKNYVSEVELLKQLWNMVLRFLIVNTDRNGGIEKWRQ